MLWRYLENQRNYPGWHLSADSVGCVSLLALLDAFTIDGTPSSRTLAIIPPTQTILAVPNNRSSSWISPTKLRISFTSVPFEWCFTESADPAELSLGSDWLAKLRKSVAGIVDGVGDYSIGHSGGGSLRLWFWWQPAAT